ncbi:glycosyltransferase [Intrasporangium calvum]|uniref:Glycosyltransferase n=1 Tax=Intrasporangium calvum TaxID=53358 RepID=A0ABT5GCY5_9MICO|nr:glycosyltransferase [Intrasporangium calvum]MDC5696088.1 glycosyltransferase [Intrasporangium calvum]
MRILLLAMGSRGDVQPMLALGDRLRREGLAVAVAAGADFGPFVEEQGLDFEPLSFEVMEGSGASSARSGSEGRAPTPDARLVSCARSCGTSPRPSQAT